MKAAYDGEVSLEDVKRIAELVKNEFRTGNWETVESEEVPNRLHGAVVKPDGDCA
jgi:hypothetical protein